MHDTPTPPLDDGPIARCRALILAGGSGTRLWPLSRALLPKQLLALSGSRTLLQETLARTETLFPAERVHVVTNEEHVFEVRRQMDEIDPALKGQIIPEPQARNTLPAILLGMDAFHDDDPDALVAVFPSDHLIPDVTGWRARIRRSAELAAEGWFVTFGVTPTHPETGYGYIASGEPLGDGAFTVRGFIEKPDLTRASQFVESGEYYWNSGMFVFSAHAFLAAVEEHQPELWQWWSNRHDRPLAHGYGGLPELSVDYGVMERVDKIAAVTADFSWEDLGSWEALYRMGVKDEDHCVSQGDVMAVDCKRSLFYSRGSKLVAIGADDMIVVQTGDATLVCSMDAVQKVKDVVQLLKLQNSTLVQAHVTVNRPWGSYTVLEEGLGYKIKRIEVLPGAKLSLQMHHHRSEHWVCIQGTAQAQVGEEEIILVENQSVDIPKATVHRLSNPGKVAVEIIEIQSGPYLEEDDIIRYDDMYGRNK